MWELDYKESWIGRRGAGRRRAVRSRRDARRSFGMSVSRKSWAALSSLTRQLKKKKKRKLNIEELKNWCFQAIVLEKTLESPLDSKEIKPVNPKRNQPWIFIGRTHAKAKAPFLWPPDTNSWLTGKDSEAGKDWGQEKKGMTEGKMVGWHHWLSGYEFEQTPGDSEQQGSLVCCSPWVIKSLTWLSN